MNGVQNHENDHQWSAELRAVDSEPWVPCVASGLAQQHTMAMEDFTKIRKGRLLKIILSWQKGDIVIHELLSAT